MKSQEGIWVIGTNGVVREARIAPIKRTDTLAGLNARQMREAERAAAIAYAPRGKSIRDDEFGSQEIARPAKSSNGRPVSLPAGRNSGSIKVCARRARNIGSDGPKIKDVRRAFWAAR